MLPWCSLLVIFRLLGVSTYPYHDEILLFHGIVVSIMLQCTFGIAKPKGSLYFS